MAWICRDAAGISRSPKWKAGGHLYRPGDNRSSGLVTYRMRVLDQGENHAEIAVENVTSVWLFVIPLFDPGDLQSLYILQRLSPGWASPA